MPVLLVKGGMVIGGILAAGWAIGQADDGLDAAARLAKWAAVGAGVYVAWQGVRDLT